MQSSFQKVPSSFVLYLFVCWRGFCLIHHCFYFLEQTFCHCCVSPSLPRFLSKTHPFLVYPHWSNSTKFVPKLNLPRLLLGPIIDAPCLGRGDKKIPTNFQFILETHYLHILQGKQVYLILISFTWSQFRSSLHLMRSRPAKQKPASFTHWSIQKLDEEWDQKRCHKMNVTMTQQTWQGG